MLKSWICSRNKQEDYTKRFFEEDVNNYFKIIGNIEFFETSMIRNEEEYSKPKVLYQVKVAKGED